MDSEGIFKQVVVIVLLVITISVGIALIRHQDAKAATIATTTSAVTVSCKSDGTLDMKPIVQ